ncbi:LysR family transcriptional regulator [Saccharopolyspora cebuensis]|uniref:LysR family transcriptional regulator n=1 Tax=Saccharopolyspora cebuensis TaxID=418759 RepID=A0ABV4CB88_9PSEU
MEMLHLRYFVAVAEHLSFSGAARRLHMATSPLSRRVRDLEQELGTALFERDSHHVRLTDAGAALLPIARDVVGRFDDLPWRLREAVRPPRRTVHIGTPPGLHPRLRERIKELARRCAAECDIKRWPGSSSDLLDAVQRGALAMALVHLPVHAEGVEVHEVLREPLGAVLPAAEFGSRTSVSLSELVDHTYVSPAPELLPAYYDELLGRLKAAGIRRKVTLSTGDYGSTGEVVANGSAFAISKLAPGSGMGKYRDDNVVVLPFEDFDPELPTGLIWRADRAAAQSGLGELLAAARRVLDGAGA